MQLRKLDSSEHSRTRALWEKVFPEDSKAFLDYYYFIKTRDNQIYVIEEDGAVRSMLQLNPYMMRIGGTQQLCNYIIAVATEEAYRKRGYMGRLLKASMMDMYEQKQPFTFLMPAAEAIYMPYDFRFVYAQFQEESCGEPGSMKVTMSDAGLSDAGAMAVFFNTHFAAEYQVCAVRDDQYYQTMIFEQQSENGGVKLLKHDDDIVGMFAFAREEDTLEIREPLYLPGFEAEFQKAVYQMRAEHSAPAKIYADREHARSRKVPLIMVRILHLETLLSSMRAKAGGEINCSFAVLDSIITKNSRVWRLKSSAENPDIQVSETEDSEGVLTIDALTALLFGYQTIDEIGREEGVILTPRLKQELGKLEPLCPLCLNEIV